MVLMVHTRFAQDTVNARVNLKARLFLLLEESSRPLHAIEYISLLKLTLMYNLESYFPYPTIETLIPGGYDSMCAMQIIKETS